MAKPGIPCIFIYVIQIPETFASTEAAEWAGSLTVCWVDIPIFLIPGEFCHVGYSGRNKVGRECVSGWQPKFRNSILMHFWVVAKEKLLPPFPSVLSSFLALFLLVWVGRAVHWCSRAQLGLAQGELNPYTDITKVIGAVMLTDLPKLELVFVVELKKKNRERWFCSHLLAFQVNKMYDMKCLWLM